MDKKNHQKADQPNDVVLIAAEEPRFDEGQTFITMEVLEYMAKQEKKKK